MPWRQSSAMDERIRFLVRAEQPAQPLEQLLGGVLKAAPISKLPSRLSEPVAICA